MKTTNPVEVQKYLSGVNFPADKQMIIKHVKDSNAPSEIVSALNGIPDREYSNSADVADELGDMMDEE